MQSRRRNQGEATADIGEARDGLNLAGMALSDTKLENGRLTAYLRAGARTSFASGILSPTL